MSEFQNIKNVLLADDDPDDQLIFVEALAVVARDIKCETASNGKEALTKLNGMVETPDLIFLDINMPLVNGFECLEILRQVERFSGIPIIMYSTTTYAPSVKKAQTLGANAFLTKPSDHKRLEAKLEKILSTDFSFPSGQIRIFSHHIFQFNN